jgi:hypothetical protein
MELGTDDEKALTKALEHSFHNSTLRRDLFKRERAISIAKTIIGVENKLRDGFPFLGGDRRFVCHVMFDIVLQVFGAHVSSGIWKRMGFHNINMPITTPTEYSSTNYLANCNQTLI